MLAKLGNYNWSNIIPLSTCKVIRCHGSCLFRFWFTTSAFIPATYWHIVSSSNKASPVYLLRPLNGNAHNSYLFTLFGKHSKDLFYIEMEIRQVCYSCIFVQFDAWPCCQVTGNNNSGTYCSPFPSTRLLQVNYTAKSKALYFQGNKTGLCLRPWSLTQRLFLKTKEMIYRQPPWSRTHTCSVFLAMWSIFTGACHCVWGGETKVNDRLKGKTPSLASSLWRHNTKN